MSKVLVTDPIASQGLERLQRGAKVDYRPKLPKEALLQVISEYDALMVRSETKVTADVIEAGKQLKVIGRAGVGVDNIDVETATKHGILVVNSPEGNTIAATELTMALLLALARRIPQADRSLRAGEWQRSRFIGTELYKKTLGIIGVGKIGREVARRARGFGMYVIGYDPYVSPDHLHSLGVEPADLGTLFAQSDFITLHTPLNERTRHLINAESLAKMKPGVRIINCARGGIIDHQALAEAIRTGQVAGAALDVFEKEPPPPDLELLHMEQNVVTPHLGASTEEAQVAVAVDVAEQILTVLEGGVPHSPVNLPPIPPDLLERLRPYLKLGEKIGRLHTQLARSPILTVQVQFAGEWEELPLDSITRSVLAGILAPTLDEPVNLVNAPLLAQQRGLKIEWGRTPESELYPSLITATARSREGERRISGTIFGRHDLRITHIDDLFVDLVPEGRMIMTEHQDKPGVIGRVGTLLGNYGINIAGMHVGRERVGGRAFMAIQVDNPISPEVMEQLRRSEGMESALLVIL